MTTQRYYRKVIRITGHDSPNVRLAKAQQAAGLPVTGEIVVPGVLPYDEYCRRLKLWDDIRISVGIDATFYEGASSMLFPSLWLDRAERYALRLKSSVIVRRAEAIGVDPAEGGDKSSWAVVDKYGLLRLISIRTPDTSVIPTRTLALMREYGVPPDKVCFDKGGGIEHADRMRSMGLQVRTIGFGEGVQPEPKRGGGMVRFSEKIQRGDERYAYVNRRAAMYGELRILLDPSNGTDGFGIPSFEGSEYAELRRQLSLIPLMFDQEGRMKLPPKNKRSSRRSAADGEITLTQLIGHSPDEADALVIAVYAMLNKAKRVVAGVLR